MGYSVHPGDHHASSQGESPAQALAARPPYGMRERTLNQCWPKGAEVICTSIDGHPPRVCQTKTAFNDPIALRLALVTPIARDNRSLTRAVTDAPWPAQ